jgi:hypothetical protein
LGVISDALGIALMLEILMGRQGARAVRRRSRWGLRRVATANNMRSRTSLTQAYYRISRELLDELPKKRLAAGFSPRYQPFLSTSLRSVTA